MIKFKAGKTYWLIKNGERLNHSRSVTVLARVLIDGIEHVVIKCRKCEITSIVVRPIEIEEDNEAFFVGKKTKCIAEYKEEE